MEGNYAATVAAVSLFSKFVERNARDTKMTTRMPQGARRERLFSVLGVQPSFLVPPFIANDSGENSGQQPVKR